MSKKSMRTWNFKIIETPSIEHCVICDGAGWIGTHPVHAAGIEMGGSTPIYPVKDVFKLLKEGSLVADVFPVYGDIDEDALDAYDSCTFMGCHFTAFNHVEERETPVIMDIAIKQSEKEGHSPDVMISSHPLKWNAEKMNSEYQDLKAEYLHQMPNGSFHCNAYYVVTLYDLTQPYAVEIMIENGADIAADDYALFRIARERYPKLWVWLSERYKEVIVKNLNLIYGYDKANQTKKDFFKSFDNFVTSMIGEKDIAETDDEGPKESVKEGVLDKFVGFKKGFFD